MSRNSKELQLLNKNQKMNESINQQISLFIISYAILLYSGSYMLSIKGVNTLIDFGIGMIAFYSLIFCANYFFKLAGKFVTVVILIKQKKSLML